MDPPVQPVRNLTLISGSCSSSLSEERGGGEKIGLVLSVAIRRERISSRKAVQNAVKAGQSAEAGGPGGPSAKVHAETEAPEFSGHDGRSPIQSR